MNRYSGTIICLTYPIALLSTAVFGFPPQLSLEQWGAIALFWTISGLLAALILPRWWRRGPDRGLWLIAALIAILATVYIQLRVPQPSDSDISVTLAQLQSNGSSQFVKVKGRVLSQPRLTRKQKSQFWFEVKQINQIESSESGGASFQTVTGKLYLTVPLLQGTGLYPGQKLSVTGILYQPKPAVNPGAFDFAAYLQRQGCFAAMKGLRVSKESETTDLPWGLWRLRQRIIRSQVRWLGVPEGSLVSSMVLGRRAVDLPYDVRDQFIKAGLAHVLAASGFHVSLLLGVVLTLSKRLEERWQLFIGLGTLILYIGLTGIQPSVMRAAIMGMGALLALVLAKKVRRLGSLLLAATILLLFNPLWLWDLGFQLSFLATLGLIVTMPAIEQKLDWLPPTIATAIAIPLAASVWTLPLVSWTVNTVPTYSIAINILLTPLIALIALGGMISALAALIYPLLGSAIAWLLYYPTHFLIAIVEYCNSLPGSFFAVGAISLEQMLFIYFLFGLLWWVKWLNRRWWLIPLFAMVLVVVPLWYERSSLFQITLLATKEAPVAIIQDKGTVTLVNGGDGDTSRYTILPFLAAEGINQIDCAIALQSESDLNSSWSEIQGRMGIKSFFRFPSLEEEEKEDGSPQAYQSLRVGESRLACNLNVQSISAEPPLLQLEIGDLNWWLLGSDRIWKKQEHQLIKSLQERGLKYSPDLLFWSSRSLDKGWLEIVEPEVAIAAANTIQPKTLLQLQERGIQFYWTGRDGAMQWTPEGGWQTTLERVAEDEELM